MQANRAGEESRAQRTWQVHHFAERLDGEGLGGAGHALGLGQDVVDVRLPRRSHRARSALGAAPLCSALLACFGRRVCRRVPFLLRRLGRRRRLRDRWCGCGRCRQLCRQQLSALYFLELKWLIQKEGRKLHIISSRPGLIGCNDSIQLIGTEGSSSSCLGNRSACISCILTWICSLCLSSLCNVIKEHEGFKSV